MTAPDPRLDEIQARLSADWEASMSGGYIGDDQCMKDRAFLLAELRKAHEALQRVECVARSLAPANADPDVTDYDRGFDDALRGVRVSIRAAVAAAKGDGE